MSKSETAVVEIAGREVVITNPDKVFFPRAGHTKLDLVEVLRRGRRGRAARHRRPADRAQALRRTAPRASRSSRSARPSSVPTGSRRSSCASRRAGRRSEIVVRDAAQLLWIVNLGCIDLNPHPVRADDLEHPDELRVDLDPGPGVALGRRPARGAGRARGARRARPARLAQDVGLARHPRQRAHRAALDASTRCAARRWRWRARWSGARPSSRPASGGRRSATASSSTTTRTPRTARWPRRGRCGRRPTRACRCRSSGTRCADCDPAAFTLVTAPARFAERGDAVGRHRRRGRLARRAARAVRRAGGRGPRRRAVAAALPEAGRRAAARRAVAAQGDAARRDRAAASRRSR